jgi:uracil-DNA glycosylase
MKLEQLLEESWRNELKDFFKQNAWEWINKKVEQAYAQPFCFPPKEQLFNALHLAPYPSVKVVIIGQDPYHGEGEANGLAFSVNSGIRIPPSLRNIFKELKSDLGIARTNTDLSDWAQQGVLLLNTTLTVTKDKPLSHENFGWEKFTDFVIQKIALKETPVVFILWGKYAQKKKLLIPQKHHLIIESAHPSPLGAHRGFWDSKPFSKANAFLEQPIQWG